MNTPTGIATRRRRDRESRAASRLVADEILNARGKMCPLPALVVKRKLDDMDVGRVLEVAVDYPQSRDNILRIAETMGNRILDVREDKSSIKIYIKKASGPHSK